MIHKKKNSLESNEQALSVLIRGTWTFFRPGPAENKLANELYVNAYTKECHTQTCTAKCTQVKTVKVCSKRCGPAR